MTIRHDAIALLAGVDRADFERFMSAELLPFFADQYRGPTRSSKADLKALALLQGANSPRRYLLVTEWEGAADAVRGAGFENARMVPIAQTAAMLKKLEGYAKRSAEKVFDELAAMQVRTNT